MNLQHGASGTVDAGVIVQHLHGELDADATRALTAHLSACEACRSLAASLEASMRRVSVALRAGDFEPPQADEWRSELTAAHARRAPSRNRRLAIAAGWVVALLAAGALTTEPVRAWLVRQWASVTGVDAPAVTQSSAPAREQAGISFVAGGPSLDVAVQTTQRGGTFTVRFDGDEKASVSVSDGGTERLAVGGGGLRIDNERASSASYSLAVPTHVQRVLLRIGVGRAVEVMRTGSDARDVAIDLRTGERVRNPPSRGDH